MAYSRRSTRRRVRAPVRRRRAPTYKRRLPRRAPRRKMTRRTVLNVTSKKKRDKMATYTYQQAQSSTSTTIPPPLRQVANLIGGTSSSEPYVFPWIATARTNEKFTGQNGAPEDEATRSARDCYMIGLSERITIQTSSSVPWQWRRICFTLKGSQLINSAAAGAYYTGVTSNGWTRHVRPLGTSGLGKSGLYDVIFKGTGPSDWINPMIAQLDDSTITVKYDKTCTLASGNQTGRFYNKQIWHPMRKTLVYNDDQVGGDTLESVNSTQGRRGMGDYYVIDFFRSHGSSTSTDVLSLDYESTLYWHER